MPRRQPPRRRSRLTGNTLFVSDCHTPYHHDKALEFLATLKQEYRPARTVLMGDLPDNFTSSRYGAKSSAYGADDEFERACDFILELANLFPDAAVVIGNHCDRPEKKSSEHGIPTERIRPIQEVPKLRKPLALWRWHRQLEVNAETVAIHGDGFGGQNPGEAAVLAHRKNVVMAHLHTKLGVQYYARGNWRNWAMNCGCLIDPLSPANDYAIHHQKKTLLGVGLLIDNKLPLPVPMT